MGRHPRTSIWLTTLAVGIGAVLPAAATATTDASGADGQSPAAATMSGAPRPTLVASTCAGIRGNGQNLFAHYGALARHVEEFGAVTCAAGGSSGSITTFLLESMWANPLVHACGDRACRPLERDARLSLLLKSVVGQTDAGVFRDVALVGGLLGAVEEEGILALLGGDEPLAGVDALVRVLRDLGPLVNPEVVELLLTSPDPVFHATDIVTGLQKGIQFQVDDPAVFLRTSVVDFDAFATFLGSFGSFYAGYGPVDRAATAAWLEACAVAGLGRSWHEVASSPGSAGATCGDELTTLFDAYREAFAAGGHRNRADDPVGLHLPAFGVTGVLTGDAIGLWEEARAAWLAAEPIPFEPDFSDVGVGWWGQERELRRMQRGLARSYDDLTSRSFVPLGAQPWREVLASSPAEPGFSPAVPLAAGAVSVGGWADPLRVLPLEAAGARATISINRRDGVGGFTADVTRLLNASDEQLALLYSTTDPASTFLLGLRDATGVWCTDWDGQGSDPDLLFDDAWTSPLITSDARLLRPRFDYPGVGVDEPIQGCVPGVPTGG